ncbi:glycerophosphodiester phosphodiesterase family protein [Silvibacterium dinghuense]|uniref:Glycerophosphodiester phosphodiesterase family protein n=1 Tax=Silvibacterium dinghuense TaxID=1560006 RepID=A0A4Q1SBY2_9BACT|nr:glycerophosphodiester phosphodiesterase family protein [Silvibacterium dinghuense]
MLPVLGLCLAAASAAAQAGSADQAAAKQKIIVISHRGEHLHHPENTLPAFQAAIDAGADFFECDVRTTSDGKLILMHDSSVDRTTNGTGKVNHLSFAQIRALDAGSKFSQAFAGTKVPTFDEALELAHGKIGIYVDTKDADPKLLIDTIYRHHMEDHVVIYGDPFFLHDVEKLQPALRVMPEAENAEVCGSLVAHLHPKVIAYDADDFKPEIIACAKNTGAKIYVDRLDEMDNPSVWQQALDLGADGIQTNKPAELVEYLRARGQATHALSSGR